MSSGFNHADLRSIVELTGKQLESEDKFISTAFKENPAYAKSDQPAGIMLINNERYWQYLTLRALLPSFPFEVRLEFGERFDIALFKDPNPSPVALGEMKRWMSASGETEIPSIEGDIIKLSGQACAQFLLIFTMSQVDDTDKQVKWLLGRLRSSDKPHSEQHFKSKYHDESHNLVDREFVVVGILLRS
jgi:hypothetical protein